MEYRVNSQSTLTRPGGQPPPQAGGMMSMGGAHSGLPPPHMQNEQLQHFQGGAGINMGAMGGVPKLPNGGSPRGYSSMERSLHNSSVNLPQVPPSYTPHQQYNSLQRNTPLQIQNSNPPQMMPQMSMPAPTPPPPYGGGGHMTPQPHQMSQPHLLNASGLLVSPHHTGGGSMQFGSPQTQNSFPGQYPPPGMPPDMHQFNAVPPPQAVAGHMGPMPPSVAGTPGQYPPAHPHAFSLPPPGAQAPGHVMQTSTLPTPCNNQAGAGVAGSMQSVSSSLRSRSKSRGGAGKLMVLRVLLLDGTTPRFDLPTKCTGGEFFEKVVDHLNLLETDYFGLQYAADHAGSVYWLELQKPIYKQVKAPSSILFRFAVKFYTSDPGQLQDEYTKVLFALQIKRDMACGMLPCAENTAALMASYIVQAELSDFDVEKNSGIEASSARYLSMFKFIPPQTDEFLVKVMEYHKNHIGQSPADADYNLLDIARRLDMYGIRLHPARDSENVMVHIAVNQQGISVFQQFQKSNSFAFSKIRKLSFKKKIFIIKLLSDAVSTYNRETIEYQMTSRNACKRFWKDCIEHHAFFRLPQNSSTPKPSSVKILQSGSSFRYAGRTQREMAEQVRNTNQARLQLRRPPSNLGAPFSRTMPAKGMDGGPAGSITPGTPGSVQGMPIPGMNAQIQTQTMPPKRPPMDMNDPNTQQLLFQQQQHNLHGSLQQIAGSMQQLPVSMQQNPMAMGPPFNRMSTTSPLPQQLIAGTPLMNRSGTPLNEPPPPRPQMMPGMMGAAHGGSQQLQTMMQEHQHAMQMQQLQKHPSDPNRYYPQLPPQLSKPYSTSQAMSAPPLNGEVIAENESDHDYENYPIPEESHPQQAAVLNGHSNNAAMMRPPSRQRDSMNPSEGKYFDTARSVTSSHRSSTASSKLPMTPNFNQLPPQQQHQLQQQVLLSNSRSGSRNSLLSSQSHYRASSREMLQPNNNGNHTPVLSHQNSRSSIGSDVRRRPMPNQPNTGSLVYGTVENPYSEGPYDFKSSYSECPYGSSNAYGSGRPAEIFPRRHGSQELLKSSSNIAPQVAPRSLNSSNSGLQSPASPPALPPVLGQPLTANFQPIPMSNAMYGQSPSHVAPALVTRGPVVNQASVYGSNRQPALARIEEKVSQMKLVGNNAEGAGLESESPSNGKLSSSGSSLNELNDGLRKQTLKSEGSTRSSKQFPELPTISPTNSHPITQFSMSNFNTLDSCATNKFSVAVSNDFSLVDDDDAINQVRRSTDTLDRGSAEINPDRVLSPTNSSSSGTPLREIPPHLHALNNLPSHYRARMGVRDIHSSPTSAATTSNVLNNNRSRHPGLEKGTGGNRASNEHSLGNIGFLGGNTAVANEDDVMNDVDDVSCASEEVFGKLNPLDRSQHEHAQLPRNLQGAQISGLPGTPQYGAPRPHEEDACSMSNLSSSLATADRFSNHGSSNFGGISHRGMRNSASPHDYLNRGSDSFFNNDRESSYAGGRLRSKTNSFDILQQLTNVDHKQSVSDEGEDFNDEDDEDLDDDLDQ